MSQTKTKLIVHGPIVQASEKFGDVELIPEAWVTVTRSTGVIEDVSTKPPNSATSVDSETVEVPKDGFVMPGLIDAHIHAPQYAFAGIGTNIPLLQWLERFTFPFEARCADQDWARRVFDRVVRRTLACGTTTASYFATIHARASSELAVVCARMGQRAFVGKVNMDRNSPDFYREPSAAQSLQATAAFAASVSALGSPLVSPIITPRFVPTCTSELMEGLGKLAASRGDPIQTHVSENLSEIAWVAELHPQCPSYADVYASHGLLTRRTLLAHGVHLTDRELSLVADAEATVVHSPLSNFSLCSGVCPVRRLAAAGVRVALGTDVSGGASASMLDSMRHAIIASQAAHVMARDAKKMAAADGLPPPLSWKEALFLATVSGADALGIAHKIGTIAVGKEFDAILVDPRRQSGPLELFGWENLEQTAEKFIMAGDDRNITSVFVRGRRVFPFADAQ